MMSGESTSTIGLFSLRAWPYLLAVAAYATAIPVQGAEAQVASAPETFLDDFEGDDLQGWRFRTGAYYSDNITREMDEELDELVAVAEFGANWNSIGTRFAAAFDGTVAYRNYTRNDFDNEARANFLALADFFIIPETLDWYVTGRLANAPIDPLATTSPINVQFINVVETGPRMTLRPGAGNELTLAVSRAEINAEESPIDHSRNAATLSFMHDVTVNSSFGIVTDAREVDFDPATEATDFDQQEAHLVFDGSNETLNLSIAAGQSRFELDDGYTQDDTTGWIRLRARRTSSSVIYFNAERTANDTATAMLRDEQLLVEGGVPGFIVTGDPFVSDSIVVRYTRGWRAHDWFIALNARDIDYFVSPLDREYQGVRIGAQFALSPRFGLSVTAAATDIEYSDIERSDEVRTLYAELDYRMNRNWSILTGVRRLDRESDFEAQQFVENMLTLFVSYAPRRGAGQ